MSTDTMSLTFITESAEETEKLAERLGQKLKGGEIVELSSDLGGGKTTFTRGLARGAGSASHVSSPTFKISNVYKGPAFDIVHYDFYRLPDAGLIRHELMDVLDDPHTVIVVEWSDIVRDVLPASRLKVKIQTVSDSTRQIIISYDSNVQHLVKGL